MRPGGAWAIVGLWLAGCRAGAPPPDAGPPPPVEEVGAAVALCEGPNPRECEFRCSGTLVAPNLVLTARHCAYPAAEAKVDCRTDVFAADPFVPASEVWVTAEPKSNLASTWHQGASFRVPSAAKGGAIKAVCGADLLLVVLKDSFSSTEAEPAVVDLGRGAPFDRGLSFDAVGYGETAPDAGDFGLRRARRAHGLCPKGADGGAGCPGLGDRFVDREFVSDATGCEGDSGAGAFGLVEASKPRALVGVLSRGELAFPVCSHAIYERVDVWGGFLANGAREAAALGGYEAPAWARSGDAKDGGGEPNPFPARALGARCSADADCDSGSCASRNGGLDWVCASPCDADTGSRCPSAFECVGAGKQGLCFSTGTPAPIAEPIPTGGSCECSEGAAGGKTSAMPPLVALGVALCYVSRARRRSARSVRRRCSCATTSDAS